MTLHVPNVLSAEMLRLVAVVKRLCGQLEKPYVPLRSASLACLLAALAGGAAPADSAIRNEA